LVPVVTTLLPLALLIVAEQAKEPFPKRLYTESDITRLGPFAITELISAG
jgi:hypothetical protein